MAISNSFLKSRKKEGATVEGSKNIYKDFQHRIQSINQLIKVWLNISVMQGIKIMFVYPINVHCWIIYSLRGEIVLEKEKKAVPKRVGLWRVGEQKKIKDKGEKSRNSENQSRYQATLGLGEYGSIPYSDTK